MTNTHQYPPSDPFESRTGDWIVIERRGDVVEHVVVLSKHEKTRYGPHADVEAARRAEERKAAKT